MKKYVILLAILGGCSDNTTLKLVQGPAGTNGIDGTNGANGLNGSNGHSLVSEYVETDLECETNGQRLDIYLDLDDSLSVSEGDIFMNSLIVCNGTNGLNGLNGADGQTGPQGLPGHIGPQGLMGATGPQGIQGAVGPQGAQGVQGPSGPAGSPGAPGTQGPQGPQGLTGAAGSSGATITIYTSASCALITGTTFYTKPNGTNTELFSSSLCSGSSKVTEIGDGDSFWVSNNKLAIDDANSGIKVITFN